MPPCVVPATVVITGASGFIGSWICQALLDSGYSVRAVVRSEAKGEYLRKYFSKFEDMFRYVVVADHTKPDAFKEAVSGNVGAVIHSASPVTFSPEELAEFKAHMVGATENLLDDIRKYSTNTKRFIYMSSTQALLGKPLGHIYTEDDWNDDALATVTDNPMKADGQTKYQAGKVLAERLVLGYPERHGGVGSLGWDVTNLLPVWTYGPVIYEFSSLADVNYSTRVLYQQMTEPREVSKIHDYGNDFVDVRDVANVTLATLQSDRVGGQRFILDAGAYTFQNLYDALVGEPGVQVGDSDAPRFSFPGPFCSSEKALATLGITFRSLETTVKDTLHSLRDRGAI